MTGLFFTRWKYIWMGFYVSITKEFYNRTVHVNMESLCLEFIPYLPEKARILDAGCGSGRDAKFFISLGYEVVALPTNMATL